MIFHGVNVVLPANIDEALTDEDIVNLDRWGFNLVRLGVVWEHIETKKGEYDTAYLEKVGELVNKLAAKGIYTLINVHQDFASSKTCGQGIPAFYATEVLSQEKSCINPRLDHLMSALIEQANVCKPIDQSCQTCPYTSPEVQSLFKSLFTNEDGI